MPLKILIIILSSKYFTLNSDCFPYSGSMPLHHRVQLSLRTLVRDFYMWSAFGHLAQSLATMVTASAARLVLRRHVIPLVSLYNDRADNMQVSLMVQSTSVMETMKNKSIVCLLRPPKMLRLYVAVYWNSTMSQPFHICHSPRDLLSFHIFDSV